LFDLTEDQVLQSLCASRTRLSPLWFLASAACGLPASHLSAVVPWGRLRGARRASAVPWQHSLQCTVPGFLPIPEPPDSSPSNNRCPPKPPPVFARSAVLRQSIIGVICSLSSHCLRYRLAHDQLQNRLYRCLRVVALHESIPAFHDARFRIRTHLTKYARCFSGSQSRRLGGSSNSSSG
jgi:hypothetical protein